MPLQNRVPPLGEIVATPERGTFMGNRGGRMHRPDRTLTRRRWASKAWITCRLAFKGRQRTLMSPQSYTELFFLDEATALAAGHRPCAECRRGDFNRFMTLWARQRGREGRAYVAEVDDVLHGERLAAGRSKRLHPHRIDTLPDGTFILLDGAPHLVLGRHLLRWSAAGYEAAVARPTSGSAQVVTPRHIVGVLAMGYAPALHATARDFAQAQP